MLKSTALPEWYTGRIQPWVHYVPIGLEYAELWDVMAFFTECEHGDGTGHIVGSEEESEEKEEQQAQGGGTDAHEAEAEADVEQAKAKELAELEAELGRDKASDAGLEGQAEPLDFEDDKDAADESSAERQQRRHLAFARRSMRVRDDSADSDDASADATDTDTDTAADGAAVLTAPRRAVPPNDALARKIGDAARTYAEQYWRQEDITAYLFRLYLEYARLGKQAGEGDYVYDPSHEV